MERERRSGDSHIDLMVSALAAHQDDILTNPKYVVSGGQSCSMTLFVGAQSSHLFLVRVRIRSTTIPFFISYENGHIRMFPNMEFPECLTQLYLEYDFIGGGFMIVHGTGSDEASISITAHTYVTPHETEIKVSPIISTSSIDFYPTPLHQVSGRNYTSSSVSKAKAYVYAQPGSVYYQAGSSLSYYFCITIPSSTNMRHGVIGLWIPHLSIMTYGELRRRVLFRGMNNRVRGAGSRWYNIAWVRNDSLNQDAVRTRLTHLNIPTSIGNPNQVVQFLVKDEADHTLISITSNVPRSCWVYYTSYMEGTSYASYAFAMPYVQSVHVLSIAQNNPISLGYVSQASSFQEDNEPVEGDGPPPPFGGSQ